MIDWAGASEHTEARALYLFAYFGIIGYNFNVTT